MDEDKIIKDAQNVLTRASIENYAEMITSASGKFYSVLIRAGVDVETARMLTFSYQQIMLTGKTKVSQ